MNWWRNLFFIKRKYSEQVFNSIQNKFDHFSAILDKNNRVLKIISDLEEKSHGDYLFDTNYIRSSLTEIQGGLDAIIDDLISLGGQRYAVLKERREMISAEIEKALSGEQPIKFDDYTLPYDKIDSNRVYSVGSKNAQLGEIRTQLGMPVPDGFAITAWAYKHFIDTNNLQARITERIRALDIKSHADLEKVSMEIRNLITSCPIPEDLAQALRKSCAELVERTQTTRFALRSSAIGEDTQFSFAGQYATFLNIGEDELVEKYRDVLASKFTPQAIYYFLSHVLVESELAMSVGCMAMVNASAAGVIYTRDPVHPEDDCLLINSIFGLGKYLVDGKLTPDLFRISRRDNSIKEIHIAKKTISLSMDDEARTTEISLPEIDKEKPSLNEEQIRFLAVSALKIEAHYGVPQDIEWAIDRNGRIFFLQTRPLRVIKFSPDAKAATGDMECLLSGGTVVCPGCGGGPVYHVTGSQDLNNVPEGAVLFSLSPFPGLITAMGKISALVTSVGNVASHMATLAREYRIPTLVGVPGLEKLPNGLQVTVDAATASVYRGIQHELISAHRLNAEIIDETGIFNILKRVLTFIVPLNMIGRDDNEFVPQNCRTFHDITRFAHQMAMEEMFSRAVKTEDKHEIGLRLKSTIPLNVIIIYIDRALSAARERRSIADDDIDSLPMKAFWSGIKKEGWPSVPPPADFKGLVGVLATTMSRGEDRDFSENSFAILSRDYMILSLRMGYHFSTIEAMSSAEVDRNYIRLQFKEGGASLDRRLRRIKLLTDILTAIGFEHHSRGDFLDCMITHRSAQDINEKLFLLGRITILTKQLDMALSSDAVAEWYTEDIMKKLAIGDTRQNRS